MDRSNQKNHVERVFRYKPPTEEQAELYGLIHRKALEFATLIADLCPPSGETMLAIRAVEDARMRANQAIAVNEPT